MVDFSDPHLTYARIYAARSTPMLPAPNDEKVEPALDPAQLPLPETSVSAVGGKRVNSPIQTLTPPPAKESPHKAKPPKSRSGIRFKNMSLKGLFSFLFCLSDVEKGKPSEKEIAPACAPPPTAQTAPLAEAVPESKSTVSTTKPPVEDLIYSASPDASNPAPSVAPEPIPEAATSLANKKHLLPAVSKAHAGRKCLVLDLDETLVHSSFKLIEHPDFVVPVEIDNQIHNVYVAKRPGVDEFLRNVGELYEVVVFTASLSKYADPVLDMLDTRQVIAHRLFRESCYNHNGNYVKDLSQLGRDLRHTIIIDNSPTSYIFHPANAVPITTWFNDIHDVELVDLIPFLADLSKVDDVTKVLDNSLEGRQWACGGLRVAGRTKQPVQASPVFSGTFHLSRFSATLTANQFKVTVKPTGYPSRPDFTGTFHLSRFSATLTADQFKFTVKPTGYPSRPDV
ncbi:hypothetical protein L0F63_006231 [Massospora cicadina]|nr:hypothetical protein L0F63_006231 [Massospora cicadina]